MALPLDDCVNEYVVRQRTRPLIPVLLFASEASPTISSPLSSVDPVQLQLWWTPMQLASPKLGLQQHVIRAWQELDDLVLIFSRHGSSYAA